MHFSDTYAALLPLLCLCLPSLSPPLKTQWIKIISASPLHTEPKTKFLSEKYYVSIFAKINVSYLCSIGLLAVEPPEASQLVAEGFASKLEFDKPKFKFS